MASMTVVFINILIIICALKFVSARRTTAPNDIKEQNPINLRSEDYPIIKYSGTETFPEETRVNDILKKVVANVLGNDTYFIKRIDIYNGTGPLTKISLKLHIDDGPPPVVKYKVLQHLKQPNQKDLTRSRRTIYTQAGYTQDHDTCKIYNENLDKLWDKLTNYFNLTAKPDSRALHNIALILGAYLEHTENQPTPQPTETTVQSEPKDKISEVLSNVEEMLENNIASTEKIKNLVYLNLKPDYDSNPEADCKRINEGVFSLGIELIYRNYKKDVDCNDYSDESKSKEREINRKPTKASETHNCSTNVKESGDNKNDRIQCLANKFIERMNEEKKVFLNKRLEYSIQNNHSRRKNTNRKREKECVSFAKRLFITTLKPMLERFMTLLDCSKDRTERSSYRFKLSDTHNDHLKDRNLENRQIAKRPSRKLRKPTHRGFKRLEDSETKTNTHYTRAECHRKSSDIEKNIQKNSYSKTNNDYNNNDDTGLINKFGRNKDLTKTNNGEDINSTDNRPTKIDIPLYYDEYLKYYKHKYNQQLEALKPSLITVFNDEQIKSSTTGSVTYSTMDSEQIMSERESDHFDKHSSEEWLSVTNKPSNLDPKLATYNYDTDETSENIRETFEISENVSNIKNNSNGYVELTHLVKNPKFLVYRPYVLKHVMPYERFLQIVSLPNFNSKDMELLKIKRYLPDDTFKVLFESSANPVNKEDVINIDSIKEDNNKIFELYL